MAFLDKNGLQTLTNKLVQGDAIKVASHRGHTIKNVIDNITRECENVASPNVMKLESNLSDFKIGKGRDVDVSGDVEEGKIEVELQGKTYQNLLDKRHNNNLYRIGVGLGTNPSEVVSENIQSDSLTKITFNKLDSNLSYLYLMIGENSIANFIKPNTTYTVIMKVKSNKNISGNRFIALTRGDSLQALHTDGGKYLFQIKKGENFIVTKVKTKISFEGIEIGKQGIYVSLPADVDNLSYLELEASKALFLEGDHTQTPAEELPQYFEGIKSSFEDGVVDVAVQGKNLFNHTIYENHFINSNIGTIGGSNNRHCTDFIEISVDDHYTLSGCTTTSIVLYDKNKTYLGQVSNVYMKDIVTFKANMYSDSALYIRITFDNSKPYSNIQLERMVNATPYESFYSKKISFNIGEPLRSLPNGVYDELRNNNGKWELVRRVGKLILDGSENWRYDTTNIPFFFCSLSNPSIPVNYTTSAKMICNNHPITSVFTGNKNNGICLIAPSSPRVRVSENLTVEQFKQKLQSNSLEIFYELPSPIVTPIEPISFDIKPLSTMTINSEIAPTSIHSVELNRASQIERGILEIAELKKRVDSLETAYDSYLLETQHKLSLLGFEYELESEEI